MPEPVEPAPTPAAPTPAPEPVQVTPESPITATTVSSRPEPTRVSFKDFISRGGKKPPAAAEPEKKPEATKAKEPAGKAKEPAPAAKKETSPEVTPDDPKKPEPVAPKAPPKPRLIRIGDESKTEEEWTKHYADLKKAAESRPDPAKPEAVLAAGQPAAAKTDEELDREFIERTIAEEGITAEEFDQAMASGDASAINRKIAAQRLADRKLNAGWAKALAEQIEALKPAIELAEKAKTFEAEAAFNAAHPDIAQHPEAAKTKAEVRADLKKYARFYESNKANGDATPDELAFLDLYEKDPDTLVAHNVRTRLKIGEQQPAPAAPVQTTPASTTTRTAPPAAHRPGAAAPSQAVSPQARFKDRFSKVGV